MSLHVALLRRSEAIDAELARDLKSASTSSTEARRIRCTSQRQSAAKRAIVELLKLHADRFCDRSACDLLSCADDRRASEPRNDADRERDLLQAEPAAGNACHVANEGKALPLPPVIPDDRRHLERAITLLGCRARGELGTSASAELTELVGCYPNASTALEWKRSLKLVRDDEIFGRTA